MNALTADALFESPVRTDACSEHGEFESRKLFGTKWTMCPACADRRIAERDAQEAVEAEAARKAEAAARWEARIGMAGIPDRFRNRTLASYVAETEMQRKALAFAQQYANQFDQVMQTGRCGVFVGKPGTGKTHLATGIALAAMERWNASALFSTTMKALRRVKDTWSRDSEESESEAIAALVFPDLLILDEVGIQHGSDTEKLLLFDILNTRYEQRKPCLLLSNLTTSEVQGYLGERIFDRLREDGGKVVVFDWASHRGKGGAA